MTEEEFYGEDDGLLDESLFEEDEEDEEEEEEYECDDCGFLEEYCECDDNCDLCGHGLIDSHLPGCPEGEEDEE